MASGNGGFPSASHAAPRQPAWFCSRRPFRLGRVRAGCVWGTTKPVPCRRSVSVSRAIICWDICSAGLVASNIIAEMDSRGCGPAHKSLLTFAVAALWLHEVVRWRLIRSRAIFNSKQVICETDQQVMAIVYVTALAITRSRWT
jgi:hypothetical protein